MSISIHHVFNLKYVASALIIASISSTGAKAQSVFDNQNLSFEKRTTNIINQMTLDEKISQLVNESPGIPRLDIAPYNWWNECLHGLARSGKATIFPQSIGLGATFDPNLINKMAGAISDEARAFYAQAAKKGNTGIYAGITFYSPNVNIFRDPRWGRGQETYGEDPYLTSLMGSAFVTGLQQTDGKYLKTVACAKHFAVHSGPEEFRHNFNAVVSNRDLYETYLPAFKALVKDAKVKSVMGAYNRTNGEACCASKQLLIDILKKQWGFKGYLTSDCGALVDIYKNHKLCSTPYEAAAMAAKMGMNLNCGMLYNDALKTAVQKHLVTVEDVDSLLYPLLLTRFQLGMFDDPKKVSYNNISTAVVDSKQHKDLAYETAVKSMVLVENKNNVLPLSKNINSLYVTGPMASSNDALIGNYFGVSDRLTTFLEGITNRATPGTSIQYKQGVLLYEKNINPIDWSTGPSANTDATIACIGLSWLLEGEEGEALASAQKGDMRDNSIPKAQIDYLKRLKETAKIHNHPLIVVVCSGCPVQLNEIKEIADALIIAWYPGEAGGYALADIIFGNANPSGRLPVTFVKSVDQLPPFEDYSMNNRTYKYMHQKPLYPFGYGLSYSTFEYSNLTMPHKIKAGSDIQLTVTVKNTSSIKGDEVVQAYITDDKASVPVPIRQLAAIQRITLSPGEERQVTLNVPALKMSLITDNCQRKIEAGTFTISVGGGQPNEFTKSYQAGTIKVKGNKQIEL